MMSIYGIIIGKVIGISIDDDYIKDGRVDVKEVKASSKVRIYGLFCNR